MSKLLSSLTYMSTHYMFLYIYIYTIVTLLQGKHDFPLIPRL